MGCGCGGRARNTPGLTSGNPLILGSPEGYQVIRVRVVQGLTGAPTGTKRYVKGSGVQPLIDSGAFQTL